MKLKAYSVRDGAVEAYLPPFFARADGEAKRSFIQACRTGSMKNMEVYYALFHIGYYDDSTGELSSTSQPTRIMTGLETITKEGEIPLLQPAKLTPTRELTSDGD